MHKQLTPVAAALALLGLLAGAPAQAADNQCAACHANVAKDHAGAAHKDLACTTCHTGTEAHLKDMKKRPAVNMDPAQCGACPPWAPPTPTAAWAPACPPSSWS